MTGTEKQTAYEANRAAWRRDHPIMPFVSPEGLALVRTVASEPVGDEARLARIAAQTVEWKANGLWS